jgi:hypothetical protein
MTRSLVIRSLVISALLAVLVLLLVGPAQGRPGKPRASLPSKLSDGGE